MPDWVHWDMEKQNAFIELKHQFNDDWSIKASYNYAEQKKMEPCYILPELQIGKQDKGSVNIPQLS